MIFIGFLYGKILENLKSVVFSFSLSTKDGDFDLPSMYWILKPPQESIHLQIYR